MTASPLFICQSKVVVLANVASVSDVSELGMQYIFSVFPTGNGSMTFRFKVAADAEQARKEFVAALESYWQSR